MDIFRNRALDIFFKSEIGLHPITHVALDAFTYILLFIMPVILVALYRPGRIMIVLGAMSVWIGNALGMILSCYRGEYRYCNVDDTEFASGIIPFIMGIMYSSGFLVLFRMIFYVLGRTKKM